MVGNAEEDFWGQLPEVEIGGETMDAQLKSTIKGIVASLARSVGVTTRRTVADDATNDLVHVSHSTIEKIAKRMFKAVAFEAMVSQDKELKKLKEVFDQASGAADLVTSLVLKWDSIEESDEPETNMLQSGMPQSVKDLRARARKHVEDEARRTDAAANAEQSNKLDRDILVATKQLDKLETELRNVKEECTKLNVEHSTKVDKMKRHPPGAQDHDLLADIAACRASLRDANDNKVIVEAKVENLKEYISEINKKKKQMTATPPGGTKKQRVA